MTWLDDLRKLTSQSPRVACITFTTEGGAYIEIEARIDPGDGVDVLEEWVRGRRELPCRVTNIEQFELTISEERSDNATGNDAD